MQKAQKTAQQISLAILLAILLAVLLAVLLAGWGRVPCDENYLAAEKCWLVRGPVAIVIVVHCACPHVYVHARVRSESAGAYP